LAKLEDFKNTYTFSLLEVIWYRGPFENQVQFIRILPAARLCRKVAFRERD
jgi:hypothetical protein